MKNERQFYGFLWIFLLVFCLCSQPTNAQKPDIRFDHLTIEDGLSQSSVFAILQDSRGFLWFGTQDGLNRYDGYNFKIYTVGTNLDSTVLSNNWINCIAEDQNSIIWIGTQEGGVNRFDPGLQRLFHRLTIRDTWGNHFHVPALTLGNLRPTVDGLTQRIHHSAEHLPTHRHRQQASRTTNFVARFYPQEIAV